MAPILGIWASSIQPSLNAGSFESIATVTVGAGGVSDITFSSIPSTYTHLQIRCLVSTVTAGQNIMMRFNSDTGNNYNSHYLYGTGSAVGAGQGADASKIFIARNYVANFSVAVADVLDYANTNKYKTTRSLTGWDANGSGEVFFFSGLWMNTSAITSINIFNDSGTNLAQYSSFALYGIKS